jgi:hypothetical protein
MSTAGKGKSRRGEEPVAVFTREKLTLSPDGNYSTNVNADAEKMVENAYEVFIQNLEHYRRKQGINQVELCNRIENQPGPTQLSGYKNQGRDIPLANMARVAAGLGVTLEEMCFLPQSDQAASVEENPDEAPPRPEAEREKYYGNYMFSYFNTSHTPDGSEQSTQGRLSYGILTIYPTDDDSVMSVAGYFSCTEAEAKQAWPVFASLDPTAKDIVERYESQAEYVFPREERLDRTHYLRKLYRGSMVLTETMADMTMKQRRGSDIVHIMLHNRAAESSSGKLYVGGLGTMVSVSRGEEHMPCCQSVYLSRYWPSSRSEEILANHLYMAPPRFDAVDAAVNDITVFLKVLYPQDGSISTLASLADDIKAEALNSCIRNHLTNMVRSAVARYYKVAKEEDSQVYKEIKGEMKRQKKSSAQEV